MNSPYRRTKSRSQQREPSDIFEHCYLLWTVPSEHQQRHAGWLHDRRRWQATYNRCADTHANGRTFIISLDTLFMHPFQGKSRCTMYGGSTNHAIGDAVVTIRHFPPHFSAGYQPARDFSRAADNCHDASQHESDTHAVTRHIENYITYYAEMQTHLRFVGRE